MELEIFNTLIGPLLFAMFAGAYGFVFRPEKRQQLLFALTTLLVFAGGVYTAYPSMALFQLMAVYALFVSGLLTLFLRRPALQRS